MTGRACDRLRVLFVPSGVDPGPYRSLERVERTTRDALDASFDVVEADAHPAKDAAGYLASFERLKPIDAVVDLSALALHGPQAERCPTLMFALGNLPNGATLLWLRRKRLKSTDVLLLNCTSDRRILERTMLGTGPRPELLPFGIDIDTFRPRNQSENLQTRRDLGLPDDAFLLVHAGRLNVQKNVHSVLLLLRELCVRQPRSHLVLAGEFDSIGHALFGVTNEGYGDRIRHDITRWGLSDRVRFTGRLRDEELARVYAAADVFTSFTLHNNENFGYAAVEAMACGTPVVASHFGGLKDTVLHETTGWHVETLMTDHGLRAVWRQAIEPLVRLAGDRELRDRIGSAAAHHVQKRLSLSKYGERLASIVREAVSRANAADVVDGSQFRFAKEAMQLYLRQVYRVWKRSETPPSRGARPKVDQDAGSHGKRPIEYDTYRWFQGPYATRDVAQCELEAGSRLALLTQCHLDRRGNRLESLDPIWPRAYQLNRAELDTIAAIEPGVTVDAIIRRGSQLGITEPAVRELLVRLIRDGVLYLDRPFSD